MRLEVQRLSLPHEGFSVGLEGQHSICLVNGNAQSHRGITVVLHLDQHVVYGMSHPAVVSRILSAGPQMLLSTKEMAHKLFEHGMKAALGRIKIGENPVQTSLETFYTLKQSFPSLGLAVLGDYSSPVLEVHPPGKKPIYVSTRKVSGLKTIELELIKTGLVVDFKDEQVDLRDIPGG